MGRVGRPAHAARRSLRRLGAVPPVVPCPLRAKGLRASAASAAAQRCAAPAVRRAQIPIPQPPPPPAVPAALPPTCCRLAPSPHGRAAARLSPTGSRTAPAGTPPAAPSPPPPPRWRWRRRRRLNEGRKKSVAAL